MERMISKSQFKPRSLEYFRLIEESGETLIITDRGRPVLKVGGCHSCLTGQAETDNERGRLGCPV